MENIRNFAIIAHIDHGKSTLADRFLEITGLLKFGAHKEQFLDRNPISRERGITIKLAPVRMIYQNKTGQKYILNLIDTPGHVDFSYEVDRTLACVEGVILLVDATQGIQAQTISNLYKALEKNITVVPAINKIDLPSAKINLTKNQIKSFLGIKDEDIYLISAKTGQGVQRLLEAVVEKISSPKKMTMRRDEVKALIFDSYFNPHQGVIAFIRVFNGKIEKQSELKLFHSNIIFKTAEVGYFTPDLLPSSFLMEGEIGYVVTNLKDIHQVRVGDTLVSRNFFNSPLPGYKKIKPMVFASIFPLDPNNFLLLKKSLEQLSLNDSSLEFQPINSKSLGAGFRIGFLGLLHAEVVRERLEREFNLNIVMTPPQIEHRFENNQFYEPMTKIFIITPKDYLSQIIQLCQKYRGRMIHMDTIGSDKIEGNLQLVYEMPFSELISDFFDRLKSVSCGFASLDWEFLDYRPISAGRLELLLNGEAVEEFSEVVVDEKSYERGQFLVNRLKELIPKQQFEVKIQARYKGKIISAVRISPIRKNVLVKSGKVLGTGDIGRKKKLLERQKEGKRKMKMVGKVEIPKEAFLKLFKKDRS